MADCRTIGMKFPAQRGMSLPELITVMAIIAILVAIAGLEFKSMQTKSAAEEQVKEIYTDLMNTRLRALQRGRAHFLVFSAGTTSYGIYEDTNPQPDGDGIYTAGSDSFVSSYVLKPTYSLVLSNPSQTMIQFSSRGLVASGQTVTIKLNPSSSGEYDCLVVDQVITGMGKNNGTLCVVK